MTWSKSRAEKSVDILPEPLTPENRYKLTGYHIKTGGESNALRKLSIADLLYRVG